MVPSLVWGWFFVSRNPESRQLVVVTFLLGPPGALDADEQRALGVLAESGLVPPLRLVPVESQRVTNDTTAAQGEAV